MAGEPKKESSGPGPDRQKKMTVLVPVAGVALIAVLVAVIVGLTDSPAAGSDKKMPFDGSNGSANDPDLKELPGGLKYRDLKVGDGPEVPPGAAVKVHYVGWLTDGTVFDSSRDRNEPAEFSLFQVVRGWQEGIPGMKVGGVRKLVIPPEMAYGSQKKGKIPANSTLIFEVEVLDILPGMPGMPPGHP